MMDCCVKNCQSRPLNTKWPESSPMWSGAGCSLAVQTRQTTSDRFTSDLGQNLKRTQIWGFSQCNLDLIKVCTPISAAVLRHSWSPFFLIVPRREILAESFPGGRSHSDNTDWSCLRFRIHAAKNLHWGSGHKEPSSLSMRSLLSLRSSRLFRQHTCFHCTVTPKRHCIHRYICGSSTSPCLPSQRDVAWSFRVGHNRAASSFRLIEWATVKKQKENRTAMLASYIVTLQSVLLGKRYQDATVPGLRE